MAVNTAADTEAAPTFGPARGPRWRSRTVGAAAWVIAVLALCPPRLTIGVGGDALTSSWVATLEMGLNNGLQWGSQIVWPYGPYGALDFNLGIEPRILLISLLVHLLAHVAFLSLLAILFLRRNAPRWLWIASAACFVIVSIASPLELNAECLLIAVVASWLAVSVDGGVVPRWGLGLISLGGIALALASLDKIGDSIDAIGILLVVTVYTAVVHHNRRIAIAGWGTFLCGWLFLWMLAAQGLSHIPAYADGAIGLIGGYSSAMVLGAASWVTVVAALTVASLVTATVVLTLRRRFDPALATALAAVVVGLLFKEGFTQADPVHIDWFLVPTVYVLVILGAIALTDTATLVPTEPHITPPQRRHRGPLATALGTGVAVVALLVATATNPQLDSSLSLADRVAGYGGALASLVSPAHREAVRSQDIADFAAMYRLPPPILARVRGGTLDVLPWFNPAPLVYGVRGALQPVLQSYAAFTSSLDGLDAAFFAGASAPDFVVLRNLPIDKRLLQFDEPLVVRALVDGYKVDPLSTATYVLLDKRLHPSKPTATALGNKCVSLGQQVTVPQMSGQHVYAHVHVAVSALGAIAGLVYRPGILYITLTTRDRADPLAVARTHTYRFVSGTADDGLLVSGVATDADGLAHLLAGDIQGGAVTGFRITTASPGEYAQQMCVRFESTAVA